MTRPRRAVFLYHLVWIQEALTDNLMLQRQLPSFLSRACPLARRYVGPSMMSTAHAYRQPPPLRTKLLTSNVSVPMLA